MRWNASGCDLCSDLAREPLKHPPHPAPRVVCLRRDNALPACYIMRHPSDDELQRVATLKVALRP